MKVHQDFFNVYSSSAGTVLLQVLVIFILFLIMMVASIRFINTQFHATVNDEERQKAFRLAEQGPDYVAFLLNSGAKTVPQLLSGPSPVVQQVSDPITSSAAGSFSLTFASPQSGATTEKIMVTSVGHNVSAFSACATTVATVERVTGGGFSITATSSHAGCS